MVNYKSRGEDDNIGASLIGGALDMLSQYEANQQGDEFAENNPSDKMLNELKLDDKDKESLKQFGGSFVGGHANAMKHALKLTPLAFHALTEHARKHKDSGQHHIGVLHDIMNAKSPHHLARMIHNDLRMGGSKIGGSAMGGNFFDTLGNIAKTVAPFVPLML